MTEYLKLAAAFTVGLGAGILASKRFFQLKYEKIANEEIESVRQTVASKVSHIIEETSLDNPEEFSERLKGSDDTFYSSSIDNMYTSVKKSKDDYIQELVEKEHPEDDRPEDCYEISETEYSETALGYDKLTLHYYIDDDMLVNADNDDWTNTELGAEAYELIRTSGESNLYFRNDPDARDYEVVRIKGAYYIEM